MFLVEGETDTMRLWQEMHDHNPAVKSGVVGLSGLNTWTPQIANSLREAKRLYVLLDNDDPYDNPIAYKQGQDLWKQIREDIGPQRAKRLRMPEGVKDVCEFFDSMDLETLELIVKRGAGSQSRYRPLDLTKEPPAPRWLLDGLIAKGDVTLLVSPPGIGKSWITMGLSTAIAEGHESFLGQAVLSKGRVLYVDQENPDDVIYNRLGQLGLLGNHPNLRYLWNQGIRLDRNGDDFLEEALDFSPELIVLDSLTRMHTQDENNAGAMAALFNNAIQPLARDTGAAVLLIHHTARAGNARGSIDIEASADAALKLEGFGEDNPGKFMLKTTKSRRRLGGETMIVGITDMPDGSVQLVTQAPLVAPF